MSTTEMWSVKVYDENPVHTWLKVYNYGGLAGTLCVNTGDAPELVARLTTHMRSENVRLHALIVHQRAALGKQGEINDELRAELKRVNLLWWESQCQVALGLAEEKITPEPDRDLEEIEGNAWDDEPGLY